MKLIKFVSFFLFAIAYCTSYAYENKHIFVGHNQHEGAEKVAFVLELVGEDLEQYVHMSEDGEVYLKVDKIMAIPKESLSHVFSLNGNSMGTSTLVAKALVDAQELEVKCPGCGYYYVPRPGRGCPNPNCSR